MILKHAKRLGLVALASLPLFSGYSQPQPPGSAPATPSLSPAATEVVKLAEAGTSDDVILGYIQNSQSPYNLSADNLVYLKDTGLSSQVITAMLNHDSSAPAPSYNYNQQLYPPTGQTPPPPAPDQPMVAPPADTTAPAYVNGTAPPEVNYFYNELSPYGQWVDLDGYGWCWQPSVVVINHGWRPYCDSGHWVYSDAGWFWASDYSWGWAPFHYGRWHLHPRCGWVWFPDTTWAPAWVVWRSAGDNCGWAPLPYGAVFDARQGFRYNGVSVGAGFDFGLGVGLFTFVGFHDFTAHDVGNHRLPPAEVTKVFRQTTVINNYTINNNHTVVNHGIPVERISAATHTQIRTVAIHDVPAGSGKPAAGNGAIYRHELQAPSRATTPVVAQKINDRHPVIQHATAPASTPARTGTQTQYTAPQPRNQGTYTTATHQPASSTPTAARPETPVHTTAAASPTISPHYASPNYTAPKQPAPLQTSPAPAQNTHVYYPKSYYQAQSAHMLPADPASFPARSSTPASAPVSQPAGGARGQLPSGQSKQPQR